MQYFKENPDYLNPKLNTKFGAYSEGCGLDNVLMSWGHDDYMYLVIHTVHRVDSSPIAYHGAEKSSVLVLRL